MSAITPQQFNESKLHKNFHVPEFVLATTNPDVLSAYEKMINPKYKNNGTIGSRIIRRTNK